MTTRILLAMLTCLLAFTTSASAECAWILWEETEYTRFEPYQQRVEWRISYSSDKRAVCQSALLGGLRTEIAQWSEAAKEHPGSYDFTSTEIGQMWVLKLKQGAGNDQTFQSTTKRYICLPDTVDPRGPKGAK